MKGEKERMNFKDGKYDQLPGAIRRDSKKRHKEKRDTVNSRILQLRAFEGNSLDNFHESLSVVASRN